MKSMIIFFWQALQFWWYAYWIAFCYKLALCHQWIIRETVLLLILFAAGTTKENSDLHWRNLVIIGSSTHSQKYRQQGAKILFVWYASKRSAISLEIFNWRLAHWQFTTLYAVGAFKYWLAALFGILILWRSETLAGSLQSTWYRTWFIIHKIIFVHVHSFVWIMWYFAWNDFMFPGRVIGAWDSQ